VAVQPRAGTGRRVHQDDRERNVPVRGAVLTKHDLFWHTFTIDQLDIELEAPLGGTREVTFTVPASTYRFYGRAPAHAAAGMRGALTIR
jgi:hypothetical protein